MRAMVLRGFNTPLVLEDIDIPKIGEEDVLLKVKACGVCGTDLKISSGRISTVRLPLIMGHEPMGEIVAVGDSVKGFNEGDRVIVSIYQPCGACKFCLAGRHTLCVNLHGRTGFELDGGFAEYLKVPATNVIAIPDCIDDATASILSCGVATPYHALKTRAGIRPGDTVAVMGVGGLGIHAIQIAKLCGAKVFAIDIAEEHLKMAEECGADYSIVYDKHTFNERIRDLTEYGPSVIFETVGKPFTIQECLKAIEPGGKLVMAGYYPDEPFAGDTPLIVLNELEILGTRAITKNELVELVTLVADGRIKPIVTGGYELEQVNEVLCKLRTGDITGRVVIKP